MRLLLMATLLLAAEGQPTLGDGWKNTAIWSRWDATARTFALVYWRDGVLRPLPVAPNAREFDATLGPGRGGVPTIVYARCADPGAPHLTEDAGQSAREPSGCDVRTVDLASGRERAVPGASAPSRSEVRPSVHGRRVAFAVHGAACDGGRRVRVLVAGPGGRVERLRGDAADQGCGRIDALRLTRDGALVVWTRTCTEGNQRRYPGCTRSTPVTRLLLLTARRARVLATMIAGESGPVAMAGPPVLDGGHAYIGFTTPGFGDTMVRVRVRDRRVARADIGTADAYGTTVWLGRNRILTTRGGFVGPMSFEGGCGTAGCPVEILDGLRFR